MRKKEKNHGKMCQTCQHFGVIIKENFRLILIFVLCVPWILFVFIWHLS